MVTIFPPKCECCGTRKTEIQANGGRIQLCPLCRKDQVQQLRSQAARELLRA